METARSSCQGSLCSLHATWACSARYCIRRIERDPPLTSCLAPPLCPSTACRAVPYRPIPPRTVLCRHLSSYCTYRPIPRTVSSCPIPTHTGDAPRWRRPHTLPAPRALDGCTCANASMLHAARSGWMDALSSPLVLAVCIRMPSSRATAHMCLSTSSTRSSPSPQPCTTCRDTEGTRVTAGEPRQP